MSILVWDSDKEAEGSQEHVLILYAVETDDDLIRADRRFSIVFLVVLVGSKDVLQLARGLAMKPDATDSSISRYFRSEFHITAQSPRKVSCLHLFHLRL